MITSYTKKDISITLSRPVRTITYWTDFGLVVPNIAPSRGKGRARLYDASNLIEFTMLNYMTDVLKVPLDKILFIFKCLRQDSDLRKDINLKYYGFTKAEKIEDFFKDKSWGDTKDILYIENFEPDFNPTESPIAFSMKTFHVIDRYTNMNEIFSYNLEYKHFGPLVAHSYLLGRIKIQSILYIVLNDG